MLSIIRGSRMQVKQFCFNHVFDTNLVNYNYFRRRLDETVYVCGYKILLLLVFNVTNIKNMAFPCSEYIFFTYSAKNTSSNQLI